MNHFSIYIYHYKWSFIIYHLELTLFIPSVLFALFVVVCSVCLVFSWLQHFVTFAFSLSLYFCLYEYFVFLLYIIYFICLITLVQLLWNVPRPPENKPHNWRWRMRSESEMSLDVTWPGGVVSLVRENTNTPSCSLHRILYWFIAISWYFKWIKI